MQHDILGGTTIKPFPVLTMQNWVKLSHCQFLPCLELPKSTTLFNGEDIPLQASGQIWFTSPPRGNFIDHDFLEALCLASFLQHVSSLAMEALPSNSPLHMLPIQRHKFNIKRTEVRIHVNICRCSIKNYFV